MPDQSLGDAIHDQVLAGLDLGGSTLAPSAPIPSSAPVPPMPEPEPPKPIPPEPPVEDKEHPETGGTGGTKMATSDELLAQWAEARKREREEEGNRQKRDRMIAEEQLRDGLKRAGLSHDQIEIEAQRVFGAAQQNGGEQPAPAPQPPALAQPGQAQPTTVQPAVQRPINVFVDRNKAQHNVLDPNHDARVLNGELARVTSWALDGITPANVEHQGTPKSFDQFQQAAASAAQSQTSAEGSFIKKLTGWWKGE